ncbi:UPF0758 protein [Alteripontixanthobacter maritimus]|uniref:UPF0758 protein n=1 Tax=Alteripontixanthobacter maritimus TaxID=2161824 RepID=A0A369Q903_9SPHN|nr:JAB domain-containing protein [Alteripontixanthobacter maritimus]RDC61373.1 UPF0758 protein [Alteripontixanthobacter maritimus]
MASLLRPLIAARADAVAARLIEQFGRISCVMSASEERLASALPDDIEAAAAIVAARHLCEITSREELVGEAVTPDDPRLISHLAKALAGGRERFHIVYLDAGGRYLHDEQLAKGTRSAIDIGLKDLLRRVIDLDAASVILAHNHPSGDCRPSEQDRATTEDIVTLAGRFEIVVKDHLIFAGRCVYSMRRGEQL